MKETEEKKKEVMKRINIEQEKKTKIKRDKKEMKTKKIKGGEKVKAIYYREVSDKCFQKR